MAEIKSTMDLVMERLAKMDLDAAPDLDSEEEVRQGMRMAALYLRGDDNDLAESFVSKGVAFQKGVVRALLRNIVLPKTDEQKEGASKAMEGMLLVGRNSGDLMGMFQDMNSILDRYNEHRTQMLEQLREAFTAQMAQMESNLAQQTGVSMKLDPSQHPKFREEWQRLQGDLDEQYGRAIDQYKDLLTQRFGG